MKPFTEMEQFVTIVLTLLAGGLLASSDFTFDHEGKCSPDEAPMCKPGCNKIFDPVCGFSPSKKIFLTFNNNCLMDYKNQCYCRDFILAHGGPCSEPELENCCERVCPAIYNPVCGYSPTRGYKTYTNNCSFARDLTCLGCDYVYVSEGNCTEGPLENCPAICPFLYKPLCAFSSSTKSYKNFSNECLLSAENRCKYGDYVKVHDGECTPKESGTKCYRNCPCEYKPVCAVSGTGKYRIFPTMCELEVAIKCDGADYSVAYEGKCTAKDLAGSCNFNCPLCYIGICGFSPAKGWKTFASKCFMERENTCTLSDYKMIRIGKCTPDETGGKCKTLCQPFWSPVCAKSPTDGYKTYPNFCGLDMDNSCFYKDYNFVHQSECFPWELCKNCKP